MRAIFLSFFSVFFLFLIVALKSENENLVDMGRQFLVQVCKNLHRNKNPENLVSCYKSSIYFCEYLWIMAYIIEEKKPFKTQMVLPKGTINDGNCMEINPFQCVTTANFLINENSISVEYSVITSMISPVIEECNLQNSNLLFSLNALWIENSNKISEMTQGIIIGRGYQELVQLSDPLLDLSSIICHSVEMYLFTEKYRMKLLSNMKDLILYNDENRSLTIQDPVYTRIPLKYDQELDLSWLYCKDLPGNLSKLDGQFRQIKIDLHGKGVIIKKDILTNCKSEYDALTKIITWEIVN